MKRLILSADNRSVYSGPEGHWTYCVGLTEIYAKAHNIDFQCIKIQKETTGRHIAWTKIPLLRKFIDNYDEILWLDTDATVINMNINAFEYIKTAPKTPVWPNAPNPVAYMLSEKSSSGVNTGITLFDCRNKDAIRNLLNDWWNDIPDKKFEQESPWDSAVVNITWKANQQKAQRIQVADIWSTQYMSDDQVFIHIDSRYKNIRLHEAKRFFYKQLKPKVKKIGIYVRQQNYYTNGAGQNAIFLRHSFEALGYTVDLLVTYDKTKPDRVADNIPYVYIDSSTVDYSKYELVIYGSKIAPYNEQQTMRKLGVRTAMFSPCASFDALHNESFIHPSKPDTVPLFESTFKDISDEVWHLDNHWDTTAKYIETLNQNKIPIREIKITWSPMFILNNSKLPLYIQPSECKTLDIVIMEPNSGYAKSAWIPLVICEHLYQTFPSILNKVYLFNKPQEGTQAIQMIHRLSIWKDKKLRLLNRIPINDMLDFFSDTKKHGNNHVAFLSHQINVPLNYAYFDTMYSGFPFVHNSHMLHGEKQGSYYETVEQGATALINTMAQNIDITIESSRNYLETRNPYNKTILESFETMMIPSAHNNLPLLTISEYSAPELAPTPTPAPAPEIQVVVLYCKEDRKRFQEQQFKDIHLPWPITFFPAFTPENSKEYINEKHPTLPEEDGLICCMRSHAAALNWYVKTQKTTEYLLILEDDVALLKDGFVEKVNTSIALWEKHKEDIEFLSLGYFPKVNFKGEKSDGMLHWNINQGNYTWGTQVVLVNKSSAMKMVQLFHHQTTKSLYTVLENREKYQNRVTRLSPDVLYPIFFRQGVILPTLAMEADFNSNILKNASQHRWTPIIKESLLNPKLYYSEPFVTDMPGYTPILSTDNKDKAIQSMTTKAYTICLIKDDTSQIGRYLVFLMNELKNKGINVYPLYGDEADNKDVLSKSSGILVGSRIPSETEFVFNKIHKVPVIYVFATNPTVDDVERFSYTTTIPAERMDMVRSCNKIWLANHLKQHESYVKTLYTLPVSIIPNLWSNSFSSIELRYTPKDPSTQLEIVLLDRNTTFNTSGWKSLVICEQLHLQHPNLLSKVYMFNTPDTNKTSMDMIHSLTLMKQGKVRIFKSLPIKDIISFFLSSKQNVVFLSNQIFDDMSYDYYDALYAGFPLVHSSKILKDANISHYYDSLDIQGAVHHLQIKDYDAQTSISKNRQYLSTLTVTDTTVFQ